MARLLIDLHEEVKRALRIKAADEGMLLKPYIEKRLTEIAFEKRKRKDPLSL